MQAQQYTLTLNFHLLVFRPVRKNLQKAIIGLIMSFLSSVRPHETAFPLRTDFREILYLGFFSKIYRDIPTKRALVSAIMNLLVP
jgi:hypothetical protein